MKRMTTGRPTQLLLWLVALSFYSLGALATDCNSDCRKNCKVTYSTTFLGKKYEKSYVDDFCHGRCIMEKEIACKTGITSCDTWKVTYSLYYKEAIEAIQQANRQNWRPHDEHDCQMLVDQFASGASGAGALKTLYTAYSVGVKAALAFNKATVIGALVQEGVKHFLHCSCSAANYKEAGSSASSEEAAPSFDEYYISRIRIADGKWAEQHGKSSARASMMSKTKELLDGKVDKTQSGFYSSNHRTLTEAICGERSHIDIGTGGQSLTASFKYVNDQHWDTCLFRVRNTDFTINNIPIHNRFMVNLRGTSGAWVLEHGAKSQEAELEKKAKDFLSGNVAEKTTRIYSSSRLTKTSLSCTTKSSSGGGVSVEDSFIQLFFGKGDESLTKAFAAAKDKGYKDCKFETDDVGFASLPL